MNAKIQSLLQSRIEEFAADVTRILQEAVADSVADALSSTRPRAGAAKPAAPKGKGRVTDDAILRALSRGPLRIEELAVTLGAKTKALKGPLKALVAARAVKTAGKARGTTYAATGVAPKATKKASAPSRRKRNKKKAQAKTTTSIATTETPAEASPT